MADAKNGELFRRNYQRSPVKLVDSERARRRIFKVFEIVALKPDKGASVFAKHVELSLGIKYPTDLNGYNHERFWVKSDTGDFLSAITVWVKLARAPEKAVLYARQIFEDEDLHYRIDDDGGVHYLVDEPFAYTVESTLSGLGDARFTAARHALEVGLNNLGPTHQSGKGLIRGVFEAAESTFLVVVGPAAGNRLNGQALDKHLKPMLLARYATEPDVSDKVARMLAVFETWVKDAHPYRHGAPFDQIHEAPLDLAILSANTGMGFIRFLAGL